MFESNRFERYFLTKDGLMHPEYKLFDAYYFITGNKADDDMAAYHSWLEAIMGVSIVKIMNINQIEITPEFAARQKCLATVIYSRRHNVSTLKAKEAVESIASGGV